MNLSRELEKIRKISLDLDDFSISGEWSKGAMDGYINSG